MERMAVYAEAQKVLLKALHPHLDNLIMLQLLDVIYHLLLNKQNPIFLNRTAILHLPNTFS